MSKYSITDDSHLTTLNDALKDNLYIGGHVPNTEDALVFEQFVEAKSEPNQDKHINLWSWFALVVLFQEPVGTSWKHQTTQKDTAPKKEGGKKAPKTETTETTEEKIVPPVEAKADDNMDLFGDDGDDDGAAMEELRLKNEAKKAAAPKKKDGPIAKSIIIMDVKVWDPEQNLDELAAKVLAITKDGLTWKTEYRLEPVAFGVKKIVVGCVVEDEKVSIDEVIEELESWEEEIQSVDITTFNKI